MRRFLFFAVLLANLGFALGQYLGPVATTYNPNKDKYYVCYNYTNNIAEMDYYGNRTTFISGLTSPNNVYFANLPSGSALVVLDSNVVKVFDTTGTYLTSLSISGAKKLQDAAFDAANQTIYISDIIRGYIYKITFGAAPFYLPTVSNWITGLNKPAALHYQSSKSRLLMGLDSTGTQVYAINTSNKTISVAATVNLDNIVGLDEDNEGNLYIAAQGSKYYYQLNKYYSGTPKKLVTEPKTGDVFIDKKNDRWIYTCIKCATTYIVPIHVFGPGSELAGCPGDSLVSYYNTLINNIGTFEKGNEFIAQLSDSVGSFSNPIEIGRVTDTNYKTSIRGKLPIKKTGGVGYRTRWVSTKPKITGTLVLTEIYSLPTANVYGGKEIPACNNATVTLGSTHDLSADISYQWFPSNAVDSPNRAVVKHKTNSAIWIKVKSINNATGCKNEDSAKVKIISNPDLSAFKDSSATCKNTSLQIGAASQTGFTYLWTPKTYLDNDTISNPIFAGEKNTIYNLKVTGPGGCSSNKTINVKVKKLPSPVFTDTILKICNVENKNILVSNISNCRVEWNYNGGKLIGPNQSFNNISKDTYQTIITDTSNKCAVYKTVNILKTQVLKPILSKKNDSTLWAKNTKNYSVTWYENSTKLTTTDSVFKPQKTGIYKVCNSSLDLSCTECSDTIQFQLPKVNLTHKINFISDIKIVKNSNMLLILYKNKNIQFKVYDQTGKQIAKSKNGMISIFENSHQICLISIDNIGSFYLLL